MTIVAPKVAKPGSKDHGCQKILFPSDINILLHGCRLTDAWQQKFRDKAGNRLACI